MQATREAFLLAVRQGRGTHQGVPPAAGKRRRDRNADGHASVPPVISFTPRPHISVEIKGYAVEALIDTGSEISFISRETADALSAAHCPVSAGMGAVQLADGRETQLHGSMQIPIPTHAKTVWHKFQIMPTLGSPMLIGVDLWAKMGYAILAPPAARPPTRKPAYRSHGGARGTHRR